MKEQTDRIILESLQYTKRRLASAANILLLAAAVALLLSPLFLAGQSFAWVGGIVLAVIGVCWRFIRKRGICVKITNKTVYLAAVALQGIALVLEILPIGAVMVFAAGPNQRIVEVYSYFSLLPLGYANYAPMLTGVLTGAFLLLGGIGLHSFDAGAKWRKRAFVCSVLALLFSLVPLLLFGPLAMTAASYGVSGALLLSLCLQAVANRKD